MDIFNSNFKEIVKFHKNNLKKYIVWPIILYFVVFFVGIRFNITENLSAITEYKYEFVLGCIILTVIVRKEIKKVFGYLNQDRANKLDTVLCIIFISCLILIIK